MPTPYTQILLRALAPARLPRILTLAKRAGVLPGFCRWLAAERPDLALAIDVMLRGSAHLKAVRQSLRLTQAELAEALACSLHTVQDYEQGITPIPAKVWEKIEKLQEGKRGEIIP